MIPSDWIPHRRGDRELVGYLVMVGDGFQPRTLFGFPLAEPLEYLDAEELLEREGMACLGERWRLVDGDRSRLVRIVEADAQRVVVADDDFGQALAVGTDLGRRTELSVPTDRLERQSSSQLTQWS